LKTNVKVKSLVLALIVACTSAPTVDDARAQGNPVILEEPVFIVLAKDPHNLRNGPKPGEGWIPVPDTKTDVRLGGFVQLNVIHDFQDAGYPYNWFVPGLTPVPTDATPSTEFDARSSRFTFETRTKDDEVGYVSTMISMDFYALSGTAFPEPRLRQAYVTWVGRKSKLALTVGQSWSTYLDLAVYPETSDLQGPNGMTGSRQGVVRGSRAFGEKQDVILDIGIEQPATAVQNGSGITDLPDFVARLNWQRSWGHLQVMGLARQLKAESTGGLGRDAAFGYGLSLSGSWKVPGTMRADAPDDNLGERQDGIQFQVQGGSGSGRYNFDLSTTYEPQDAIYDDANQSLETLDQFGFFVAYRHWWSHRLRSTVCYSRETVDNLEIQADDVYASGTYVFANLVYRGFGRMDVGLEYFYGEREVKDGRTGHANRAMLVFNFGF